MILEISGYSNIARKPYVDGMFNKLVTVLDKTNL